MITIEDIISYSKPHGNKINGARQTILKDDKVILSIVGGASGLYGDFVEDFEIAVLDKENRSFITRFFRADINDDVLPYQTKEQVEELANLLFKKGFQVG